MATVNDFFKKQALVYDGTIEDIRLESRPARFKRDGSEYGPDEEAPERPTIVVELQPLTASFGIPLIFTASNHPRSKWQFWLDALKEAATTPINEAKDAIGRSFRFEDRENVKMTPRTPDEFAIRRIYMPVRELSAEEVAALRKEEDGISPAAQAVVDIFRHENTTVMSWEKFVALVYDLSVTSVSKDREALVVLLDQGAISELEGVSVENGMVSVEPWVVGAPF